MGTKFMALLSTGSLSDDPSFSCIPQRTGSMSKKHPCMGRNHKYLGVICYCRTGQAAQLGRGPAGHAGWQVQPGNTCRETAQKYLQENVLCSSWRHSWTVSQMVPMETMLPFFFLSLANSPKIQETVISATEDLAKCL